MRLNGMSVNAIAAALGITKAAVANVVQKRGLSAYTNIRKSPPSIDKGKIGALRRAGWSVRDIASDMRLSEETVTEVILNAGL